jgi:hypothetical protein
VSFSVFLHHRSTRTQEETITIMEWKSIGGHDMHDGGFDVQAQQPDLVKIFETRGACVEWKSIGVMICMMVVTMCKRSDQTSRFRPRKTICHARNVRGRSEENSFEEIIRVNGHSFRHCRNMRTAKDIKPPAWSRGQHG